MLESREVTAVDGKPSRKGSALPEAPLLPDGSTANLLFASFVIDAHEYKQTRIDSNGGKTTMAIEFASKQDQTTLIMNFEGKPFVARDSGRAWIDTEAMNVTRLELRILHMRETDGVSTTADFAKIDIDGREFQIAKVVTAESREIAGTKVLTRNYVAEYSDCRKFEVSVKIK